MGNGAGRRPADCRPAGTFRAFPSLPTRFSTVSPDTVARLRAREDALEKLVRKLEVHGSASDDDWQSAIETMLSLANETT